MSLSFSSFLSLLPPPHPAGPIDYSVGFLNIFLTQLVLTTPCTPGWKLFRAGVAAPIIVSIWVYLALWPILWYSFDHWGIVIFLTSHAFRTLEWLVFFPAEENLHRLVPKSSLVSKIRSSTTNGKPIANGDNSTDSTALVPEPIPPPFTFAKFCWAASLWWSIRGVGWNFCCPLPSSSVKPPYTRGSTRWQWLKAQTKIFLVSYIVYDSVRTFQNLTWGRSFFHDVVGIAPSYSTMTSSHKALYSIAVVTRVYWGLQSTHFQAAALMVTIGGMMGWEGELWSPWGWPPLFGSLIELWKHPGLSTMWSRTWQGYNRRFLYVFGWIFIGEKVLGLTHTGLSSHPTIPPSNSSSQNSPNPSGQVSPSHPLPTTAPQLPTRKLSPRLMLQNLIKSLIVFGISGLHHDLGVLKLFWKFAPPGARMTLRERYILTPFFFVQPLALAVEAAVKTSWRGWKLKTHPEWKKGGEGEPGWLVLLERAIGFAWTWIWLGWTAGWFVEGLANMGAFRQTEDEVWFSLVGGLLYGKWQH
ncbi:hypothetical protein CI109_104645 [Kwoniella shandongensis]|uniref:Wax synthase domain-containing protein n=1 Tax=Kwoniella shandongensis TaxID=1734106 RepID=A0A5M6BWX9_9TREE|nr:uncharacterized protein CI109_004811 [Kwoniella shandongensis]KAA5526811.1 hypothetical protein CI109_004811 [Kwoniella shandongensis]